MPLYRSRRELLGLAFLVVAVYLVSIQLDLFEAWHGWALRWEVYELDELLLATSVASLGLLVLSIRRQRVYRREVERRREAQAQLERSMALKSLFLASMSHEIRTPMTGVIGIVDLLETLTNDAEQRELLDTLRFSSKSLLRIINNLLDFSKLEAGGLDLELEPFSPREEVGRVLELFGANAEAKGILLFQRVEPQVPERLQGDAARLVQVLTNLVGNSLKFIVQGEVEIRLDYEAQMGLKVVVRDTGPGIEPDVLKRIFDSYVQAPGQVDGTGLGLAICKGLVEAMGGQIQAESKLGQGASFRFHLPLKALEPAPALPEPKERWVLVEPHQGLFESARADLAPQGVAVFQAFDWAQLERVLVDKEPTKVLIEGWFGLSRALEMAESLRQNHPDLLCCLIRGRRQTLDNNRSFEHTLFHPLSQRQWRSALDQVRPQPGAEAAPLSLLVVDDDRISRMTLSRYLEKEGVAVHLAESAEQALETWNASRSRVALIDLRLPGLKGDELACQLKGLPDAPYLVCFSSIDPAQGRLLVRGGTFDEFLPKPLDRAQLARRLAVWNARARA